MANAQQKRSIGVSLFFAIAGVGLIVAAFATDHWIISHPEGTDTQTNNRTLNNTGGVVNFGLFSGYSALNYALGVREANLIVNCQPSDRVCAYVVKEEKKISHRTEPLQERIDKYRAQNATNGDYKSEEWFGLFSFQLYVSCVVLLCLAMVFGLVTIGFTVFNVFGRPIETITGPSGLYLWNILALLFTVSGVGVYTALYFTQLKKNILTQTSQASSLTSYDLTDLDLSYFLVVGAAGSWVVNLLVLAVAGQRLCRCGYFRSGEKEVDNGMILY